MISPQLYYTPREVLQLSLSGYFPVRSRTTLQKLIKSGKLKTVSYGTGKRPYYKIKGEELLRFLELGDYGSLQVNEKDPKEPEGGTV